MPCPLCGKNHAYTIDQALKSLATTGRRLERLASGLSPKRATARPAPDKWSVKEIICHLADCEIMIGLRYRKIISEPGGPLLAYDQDAWAHHLNYRQQSLPQAIATFKVLRTGHIAILKALSRSAWNRIGQHPDYGALTLRQLVVHIADHDKNHVAQVQRLLQK
jgi:uncharacterized damage-inducible protein DinB